MGKKKIIIDLFAGAGGESCGIHQAFQEKGESIRLYAVNHWDRACETHALNYPSDEVICQDIQTLIPTDLVSPKEDVELMWASPECFPSGTLILTSEGYKPIEDVKESDSVLTHMGRWRKVTATMSSKKKTVKLKGYGHPGIETTKRHPFYIATRYASFLHRGGTQYTYNKPGFMNVDRIVEARNDKHTTVYWARPKKIDALPIPAIKAINGRGFDIDERMMWLAGRYVADGYARLDDKRGDVTISCGKAKYEKTKAMLDSWPRAGVRSTDGEMVWCEHEVRTAINFNMSSRAVAKWLIDNFGKLAHGKKVPAWLFGASFPLKAAFLEGYISGDESVRNGVYYACTVSKELIFGLSTLIATMGAHASVFKPKLRSSSIIEGRKVNCRQQWGIRWKWTIQANHSQTPEFDDDHLWAPIRKIAETERIKTVYNLSVEEDESYIAEGLVVHNCTNHSRAKGSKPLDDQSRCTPFDILRWATMLRIKRIIIENVPEFTEWGPLGKDLRPIKRERGSYFASFVQMLRGIGYDVDWRICCAADFGAPTTRRRLFIQAVKKGSGKTIRWPMPTNSRTVEDDLLGMEMKPWIPASSIIDWSIPCTPVDDRATPLAPKTMERILKGIARHWGSAAAPFLERYGRAVSSMDEPGQPSPLITEFYGTGGCRSIGEPLSTISCSGAHHGLVQPLIMEYYGNGGCTPVFNPLGTVTCKERFALVTPENCRLGFRMLQPAELAKAQSFPDWYRFTGTKTEVVKQIGNAVCPAMAKALVS